MKGSREVFELCCEGACGDKGGCFRMRKNTTGLHAGGSGLVEQEKVMVLDRVNNYKTFGSES